MNATQAQPRRGTAPPMIAAVRQRHEDGKYGKYLFPSTPKWQNAPVEIWFPVSDYEKIRGLVADDVIYVSTEGELLATLQARYPAPCSDTTRVRSEMHRSRNSMTCYGVYETPIILSGANEKNVAKALGKVAVSTCSEKGAQLRLDQEGFLLDYDGFYHFDPKRVSSLMQARQTRERKRKSAHLETEKCRHDRNHNHQIYNDLFYAILRASQDVLSEKYGTALVARNLGFYSRSPTNIIAGTSTDTSVHEMDVAASFIRLVTFARLVAPVREIGKRAARMTGLGDEAIPIIKKWKAGSGERAAVGCWMTAFHSAVRHERKTDGGKCS